MDRRNILLLSGIILVILAVIRFSTVVSVTGASTYTMDTMADMTIAIIALLIACVLFAKFFNVIK